MKILYRNIWLSITTVLQYLQNIRFTQQQVTGNKNIRDVQLENAMIARVSYICCHSVFCVQVISIAFHFLTQNNLLKKTVPVQVHKINYYSLQT
jgi:hypothetical protein